MPAAVFDADVADREEIIMLLQPIGVPPLLSSVSKQGKGEALLTKVAAQPVEQAHPPVSTTSWIGNEKVTRIHGVWYDLKDFGEKHPGGPLALQLSYLRDGTILFAMSHPLTNMAWMRKLLAPLTIPAAGQEYLDAKYPGVVKEEPEWDLKYAAANLAGTASSVEQDPFEAEIKGIARTYFQAESKRRGVSLATAMKCPPERWRQILLFLAVFLALGPVPMYYGWLPSLLITPTLVWILGVAVFHDACHFSLSTSWRVNSFFSYLSPFFCSPMDWYVQHTLGHHVYTNIPDKDPDMYHLPPVLRLESTAPYYPQHRYQQYLMFLLWPIAVPALAFINPYETWLKGTFNEVVPLWPITRLRMLQHFAGRILTTVVVYGWPFLHFESRSKALAFALLPHMVFSTWFMLNTQVNHHAEECSGVFHANWYRHQVMTSHNVAPQSLFWFVMSGGLNVQIEHHLFPCVNHWHLQKIQPLIQAACKTHGVNYPVSSSMSIALGKLWQHMGTMSINRVHAD